jgi:hypothetical protein
MEENYINLPLLAMLLFIANDWIIKLKIVP